MLGHAGRLGLRRNHYERTATQDPTTQNPKSHLLSSVKDLITVPETSKLQELAQGLETHLAFGAERSS